MEIIDHAVFDTLPNLKFKFAPDMINGLQVAQDHIKVQKCRSGYFNRLWDGLVGTSQRRQTAINQEVLIGLQQTGEYLEALTEGLTLTNRHLLRIDKSVQHLKTQLAEVADFATDLHSSMEAFSTFARDKLAEHEQRLCRVEGKVAAEDQLDLLLGRWDAGLFCHLSIASRCFAVLDELAWGDFGEHLSTLPLTERARLLERLKNKLQFRVARDAEHSSEDADRLPTELLFTVPQSVLSADYQHALCYLGSELDLHHQPISHYALFMPLEKPLTIPYLTKVSRFTDTMTKELLGEVA